VFSDKTGKILSRRIIMGEVIYSTTSWQTFFWSFVIILVLGVLGLIGVLNGIFRRKEKTFVRIVRGCAGIFLWVIGLAFAFVVFRSITSGSKTITVHLNDKQIATDNCGDGDTCKRYVLETQSGTNFVDIDVNETAYNKAQIDSCYAVTYFSGKGFFGGSESENSYQSIHNVTRIEAVACPS
jgi:hypothetical protein